MRSHPDENNQGKTLSGEVVSNDTLQDAINWFKENGIPLWGINENPKQAVTIDKNGHYVCEKCNSIYTGDVE